MRALYIPATQLINSAGESICILNTEQWQERAVLVILLLGGLDQWMLSLVSLSVAFIVLESRSSVIHRSV